MWVVNSRLLVTALAEATSCLITTRLGIMLRLSCPSAPVDSFDHLVKAHYFDDTDLEFITTRIAEHNGMIVAYRAPVLLTGRAGREEKSPIHVADVMKMR